MTAGPIIEAIGLTRHYGERVAVDHIHFSIGRGEVFGFLGPNGAGKSTTVRMLTGYIPPTSGTARIAGCDIVAEPVSARQHIGVVPEDASLCRSERLAERHADGRTPFRFPSPPHR